MMAERRMPFNFQKAILRRLGEKLAREAGVDPALAVEALDVLDPTLDYYENRELYLEELRRRGIAPPEEKVSEEKIEQWEDQQIEWILDQIREKLEPYEFEAIEKWVEELRRLRLERKAPKVVVKEKVKVVPKVVKEVKVVKPKPPAVPELVCPKCGKPLSRSRVVFDIVACEETRIPVPPEEHIYICLGDHEGEYYSLLEDIWTQYQVIKQYRERQEEARERAEAMGVRLVTPKPPPEVERAMRDMQHLMRRYHELMEKGRKECPYFGTYFTIRHGKVVPISKTEVFRRLKRYVVKPKPPRRKRPPAVPAYRGIWAFRGGFRMPIEELRRGMTDEEIKEVFRKRNITITDEGVKFIRERFGI